MPLIQPCRAAALPPARTVLCGQDDNPMVHAVIKHIQPDEVSATMPLQPVT
jgi:regulator of RNase E activity RraA